MLQEKSLYLRVWCEEIEEMQIFLRQMSKNTKARFALNMDNFYLASESPRGENCHILAVDVCCRFGGTPVKPSRGG